MGMSLTDFIASDRPGCPMSRRQLSPPSNPLWPGCVPNGHPGGPRPLARALSGDSEGENDGDGPQFRAGKTLLKPPKNSKTRKFSKNPENPSHDLENPFVSENPVYIL